MDARRIHSDSDKPASSALSFHAASSILVATSATRSLLVISGISASLQGYDISVA